MSTSTTIDISDPSYNTLDEYTILANQSMTSVGTTIVGNNGNGTYGSYPLASPATGFNGIQDDNNAASAQAGLANLITDIENLTLVPNNLGTVINTTTNLTPGLWTSPSSLTFNGSINLNATNSSDQFFIVAPTSITFGDTISINLQGNASSCNIFWLAESGSITFSGTQSSSIPGIFIAGQSISFAGVSTITGRLFAQGAAISFAAPSSVNDACVVVCYLKGTLILTNNGFIPIENIQEGDKVVTKGEIHIGETFIEDEVEKTSNVIWISKFKVNNLTSKSAPICIKKDAFGENTPFQDLYVSPGHTLLLDGKMVFAQNIINGTTIYQDYECNYIEYYHLELESHSAIFANGVLAESFLDGGNIRRFFENKKKK